MISSISTIVIGDSIGLGFAQAAGLLCDCKVGRQPHEVFAAIRAMPASLIRDRCVILSTGLSNNSDGRSYVETQIRTLLDADAALVVVLGVGPGVRVGTNEWLEEIATHYVRTKFAGSLANTRNDVEPKGIHPWSYDQVVDQVEAVIAPSYVSANDVERYASVSDDSLYDVADKQQTGVQIGYPELTPELAGRLLNARPKE